MARPTKTKAIERLRKARAAIPELKQRDFNSAEFKKWHRDTKVAIEHVFCDQPNKLREFPKEHSFMVLRMGGAPESESQKRYVSALKETDVLLESMIEEINEYWEDENQTPTPPGAQRRERINTDEVFIIHGRDERTKQTVARFLEQLKLKPVILHEQPSQGRTIIEKFEDYGDVKFAVVLLTPDDVGALKGQQADPKPRARQNVVFEFGYFIGKLGRDKVCVLAKGDIEKPSDCDGILYIPLDDENGWKMRLLQELKTAGFDIDANQAFQS